MTWREILEALGVDPDTPEEELAKYSSKGYYTREGDVVTFHTSVPEGPKINWDVYEEAT